MEALFIGIKIQNCDRLVSLEVLLRAVDSDPRSTEMGGKTNRVLL